nr:Gal-binding and CUB domains containing protein 1 [Arenicola marina]
MLPVVSLIYLLLVTCCLIQSTTSNNLETREVCDPGVFSGHCGNDQVIAMKSARYGRMRLGRCVKLDLGYLGCSSDVLSLFDVWCSGKPSCEVSVDSANEELFARRTCVVDISSHMEVEYSCIRVVTANAAKCRADGHVELTAAQGTLASHVTDDTGCGRLSTPWVLRTSPGQRVQISITDFGWTDDSQALTQPKCQRYGYISEPGLSVNQTLCGGLNRQRQIHLSSANNVIIQLIPVQKREWKSAFLLEYSVIGCPDMTPPANAWYKRDGSAAVIGCEWSEHSWHLKCEGNTWVGVVGNCTSGGKCHL